MIKMWLRNGIFSGEIWSRIFTEVFAGFDNWNFRRAKFHFYTYESLGIFKSNMNNILRVTYARGTEIQSDVDRVYSGNNILKMSSGWFLDTLVIWRQVSVLVFKSPTFAKAAFDFTKLGALKWNEKLDPLLHNLLLFYSFFPLKLHYSYAVYIDTS